MTAAPTVSPYGAKLAEYRLFASIQNEMPRAYSCSVAELRFYALRAMQDFDWLIVNREGVILETSKCTTS